MYHISSYTIGDKKKSACCNNAIMHNGLPQFACIFLLSNNDLWHFHRNLLFPTAERYAHHVFSVSKHQCTAASASGSQEAMKSLLGHLDVKNQPPTTKTSSTENVKEKDSINLCKSKHSEMIKQLRWRWKPLKAFFFSLHRPEQLWEFSKQKLEPALLFSEWTHSKRSKFSN